MAGTGLEMSSKRRLQLVQETTPGVYNANGKRLMMQSIKGELKPDSQFAKFRPAGYNVDAWNALTRTHSVFTGQITFDFEQMPFILEMLCGAAVSDVTAAQLQTLTYELPEAGERNIITCTLEDGTLTVCNRHLYAFIVSISFESERMGDQITGNVTILCRKAKDSDSSVPMTGAVAQNEIIRIAASNVTAGKTITLPATTLGAGGSVAVVLGETASTLLAKIKALAGYNDAGVVAAGPGIPAVAGTNEVQRLTYTNWVSTNTFILSFGGQSTAASTYNSAAAIQTALEGLSTIGSGNVSVAGTISGAPANGALDITFIGTKAGANQAQITISGAGAAQIAATTVTEGAAAGPVSGYVDITLGGALGNKAQTDPAPINDGSGYSITVTQQGSDGNAGILPDPVPMLPQNISARRASTRDALDAAVALKGVRKAALELSNLAEAIWFFDENEVSYSAHVDKDDQAQMLTLELATRLTDGVNADQSDLLAKSGEQPARPEWFGLRVKHPVTTHQFDMQARASCSAAADITRNNNVRARAFPMGVVIAGGQAPMRFIVKRPVA